MVFDWAGLPLRWIPDEAFACTCSTCCTCCCPRASDLEHLFRRLTPLERTSRMALRVSRATGRVTLDL